VKKVGETTVCRRQPRVVKVELLSGHKDASLGATIHSDRHDIWQEKQSQGMATCRVRQKEIPHTPKLETRRPWQRSPGPGVGTAKSDRILEAEMLT
jgi:hypothetical protein